MKNNTLSLCVAAAALFTMPAISFAQDAKPAGDPPARAAGRGTRLTPEARLKQMAETLGLTQEQQDKIKAIFEKSAPAMKELRDKGFTNLTEEDKTKMRDLMKKQGEEVDAVLTPEQKEKQKAAMEKRRGAGRPDGQPKPEPAK